MYGKPRTKNKIIRDIPLIGTQMRGLYKGATYSAEVVRADSETGTAILFDGKLYNSMSAAAYAVTHYYVNGWKFWQMV